MVLPKHLPALDGLRGLAILMVLMAHVVGGWVHALMNARDTTGTLPLAGVPGWLQLLGERSGHGVQLFFLVSAFTLTLRAARDTGGLDAYALRRIARIGPGFWLAGLGYTLVVGTGPRLLAPNGTGPLDWAVAALFGQSWQGGAALAVVPGGWSVSCEAAFYVALPLVLYAVNGHVWRAAAAAGLAIVVAQLWARHLIADGQWNIATYFHPIVQAPVFLMGIAVALLAQRRSLPRAPWVVAGLLAFAIVALPLLPLPYPRHRLPHILFALVAAPAVALAAAHPPRLLAGAAMRRLGEVSYSMYLIHFALLSTSLRIAEWLVPGENWRTVALHFAITTVASFSLACVTHRWIEQPAIRWAARRVRRKEGLLPAST